jgi:Tol biopolymer transport system component
MGRTVVLLTTGALAVLLASVAALTVVVAVPEEAQAAFPGQNGRIALCHSNGSAIVSVRPDGFGYRQEVPMDSEYTCDPSYSPDGTKLAFTSDQDGDYDIYVKDLLSGQVTQITKDGEGTGGPDRRPSWSPDGTKIVFDDQNDLWVMDATDGSDRMQLTDTTAVTEWKAAWSPEGTKIAFQREDDIWVMDANGSNQKNLTHTPDLGDHAPSWSPSGRKIAWTITEPILVNPRPSDVWKMRADGSSKVRLTFDGHSGGSAWSPGGGKIAFLRDAEGDTDVWKMNARDGSKKTNITNNDFDETDPDWQPKPTP